MSTFASTTTSVALPDGFWGGLGQGIGAIVLYAVIGVALMLVGFYAIDFTTPGKLSMLVRSGRPNAVVVTASAMLSMAFIIVIAIFGSGGDLAAGLIQALVFGLVGIIAQVLAVRVLEWTTRLDVAATIESDRFAPASIVVAAVHLALGLVVGAAVI